MQICSLELIDFRNYSHIDVAFNNGLTALVGSNGQGKTNLLEAISVVSGLGSFRAVKHTGMIRQGSDSAVIRCRVLTDAEREMLIEMQIFSSGMKRLQVNRQRLARKSDLLDVLTVTVFAPDDLELVKGGPANRRRWIDAALAASRPGVGALRNECERILRHRNALLRQARGHLDADVAITLDVWDAKLAAVGDAIRGHRLVVLEELAPVLADVYQHMAGHADVATARYESSWGEESLASALASARRIDLKRAVTTVGPHRDDIILTVNGRSARTHASQGEQRSLALALRLAVDAEIRQRRGVRPVLLLDDVFSELDPLRSAALLEALPSGQRILTSADATLPTGTSVNQIMRVHAGTLMTLSTGDGTGSGDGTGTGSGDGTGHGPRGMDERP